MASENSITIEDVVGRLDPRVPRFVVVPAKAIAEWQLTGTTTVEVTLNGVGLGRRSLVPWGDDRKWSVTLTEPQCRKVGIDTGDRVTLVLKRTEEARPAELEELLTANAHARAAWERLTPAQQRMLREEILAAKQPETRRRRAERQLLGRRHPPDRRSPHPARRYTK
jgi:hypothetical protein